MYLPKLQVYRVCPMHLIQLRLLSFLGQTFQSAHVEFHSETTAIYLVYYFTRGIPSVTQNYHPYQCKKTPNFSEFVAKLLDVWCTLPTIPSGSMVQRSLNDWNSTPRLATAWTLHFAGKVPSNSFEIEGSTLPQALARSQFMHLSYRRTSVHIWWRWNK